MICEKYPQTHIKDYSEGDPSLVNVKGHLIEIDRTAQHLGGTRAWFLCPRCNRRCAILYPACCRICLGLRYHSERLSPASRASLKAIRLRQRLGDPTGKLCAPIPRKPKWMRWHTYLAFRAAIRNADAMHLSGITASVARLRR